jgi:hypothetical protein
MSLTLPPTSAKPQQTPPIPIALLHPSEIYYTYLFIPSEFHRLPAIIDATPPPTLIRMILTLFCHITHLQVLNIQMYTKHRSMLSRKDRERLKDEVPKSFERQEVYTGERLGPMSRNELLDVLEGEVEVYDRLVGEVRRWKGEVDGLIGKR